MSEYGEPSDKQRSALEGPIVPVFFKLAIPSMFGLLAITTANIVDGVFVGNYVGPDALASISLLIPYLTLLFGLVLMFTIGGAVQVGFSQGSGQQATANEVFSLTLLAVVSIPLLNLLLVFFADDWLLSILGAPQELHGLIRPYLHIIAVALCFQLTTIALYYFARTDGYQILVTTAISLGAFGNILLDALFVIVLDWGLVGAAWATLLAQVMMFVVVCRYFYEPERRLAFVPVTRNFSRLLSIMYNGISELINEFSGGLVVLVMNWLLISQVGVDGVAAFAIVNYLIFLSLMLYYGIADALHLLVSQNFGAAKLTRIRQFMQVSVLFVAVISSSFILILLIGKENLIHLFLEEADQKVAQLSMAYIDVMWPLFLLNGLNVMFSVYLTAIQRPLHSLMVALSRSLILPVGLMLFFYYWLPDSRFMVAIPIAEALTFVLGLSLFFRSNRYLKNHAENR